MIIVWDVGLSVPKKKKKWEKRAEIWEKSASVKLAESKEVHLGVFWMKVRAERIVKDERVELRTLSGQYLQHLILLL